MSRINVNTFSNLYESLYKKLIDFVDDDELFYIINNALIYVYLSRVDNLNLLTDNIEKNQKTLKNKYGNNLFFKKFVKSKNYKKCYLIAVQAFKKYFFTDNVDIKNIETTLGNVLEKHVNRKKTGSYYTPEDTTNYISSFSILISTLNKCPRTLKESICSILKVDKIDKILNIGKSAEDILIELSAVLDKKNKNILVNKIYSLKIIDPTCGSGAFIISALNCVEKFLSILNVSEINYIDIFKNFFGLDISRQSINLTRVRLVFYFSQRNCNINNVISFFDKNFIVADAFRGSDYMINESGFDWKSFNVKFDCVIGNPPYVEASHYTTENFQTSKCGNLYAYAIERACNIVNDTGVISYIVPLPFVSTKRMSLARNYLEDKCESVYYGLFADRPGCIFAGVHQRLTIFFGIVSKTNRTCRIYSSKYRFWYKDERPMLFKTMSYYPNMHEGILPKIGNKTEESIYNKIISGDSSFSELLSEEPKYEIYMSTRIGFWMKAFDNNVFSSKEYKKLFAKDAEAFYVALALLNSSTFYFYWVIMSDCWHVTNSCFDNLRFNKKMFKLIDFDELKFAVVSLLEDLEKKKEYIGSKQTMYEYKHKYSKNLIDDIDDKIGSLFALNKSEIQYVKSYTELYRMNTAEV